MTKTNKTLLITLGAIGAVLLLVIIFFVSTYNGLVEKQTNVDNKYSQIDVQLQRQADLIPNLVAVVKDYAEFEQSTLQALTEARSAIKNADSAADQVAAGEQMSAAVTNFLAVAEAYPDLKANEQYTGLRDELAGAQNRISVARKDYNEAVTAYNTAIRKFPSNLIAGMFGFEKAELFEAKESAKETPDVGELLND